MATPRRGGFTFIELMVVFLVMVSLLAIMMITLNTVVYEAQFSRCAANLHSIGRGVLMYSQGNMGYYPVRDIYRRNNGRAIQLTGFGVDDRPTLRLALDRLNDTLIDPLCSKVDLERPQYSKNGGPVIYSSYGLYFGWGYRGSADAPAGKVMAKYGDRFTWFGDKRMPGVSYSFDVLAADEDHLPSDYLSGHPDEEKVMLPLVMETAEQVGSFWTSPKESPRGRIDSNVAFQDGSVVGYEKVRAGDSRMRRIPEYTDGSTFNSSIGEVLVQLPER